MLKIGLTGGIGSGKSLAADYFKALGAIVIDADRIAHQITEPHTDVFQSILSHFGPSILNEQGAINRKKLREIVFSDPKEKEWLENTLHPIIRAIMKEQIELTQAPYCINVIPLLTESKGIHFIDRILLIDASESIQEDRVMSRDDVSLNSIKEIIASQSTREQRLAIADDIIVNNDTPESLKQKVKELHFFYLSLSHDNEN